MVAKAPCESDSSDDGQDYTVTSVLLGYASKEPTEDLISQLGGRPEWLDPSAPPSATLAKCRACNQFMLLLLQLHGDLPEHFPSHERRIYVFACKSAACRRKEGSVRAIRSCRIAMTEAKPSHSKTLRGSTILKATETPEAKDLGCTLFAAKPFSAGQPSSNPFSTNPFTITLPNPQFPPPTDLPATFAQKACISSAIALPATIPRPAEPWPSDSLLPAAYPSYRLGADYETLDSIREAPIHTQAVDLTDYASGSAGNDKEDTETFESTIDKTFQRFADRLAQNPLQILRYEFQGTPLLYSKTDAVGKLLAPPLSGRTSVQSCGGGLGMPQCANCGAGRVFELQLMPRAIVELEVDEDGLDGMEWGTLVLGVCGQDCQARRVSAGEVGYVEEWIGVQWEEQKRR